MPWKPSYAGPDEITRFQHLVDDRDDPELARSIVAASRAVDRFCFRQFGHVDAPELRYYTPTWSNTEGTWVVETDDFYGPITALAVDRAGDGTYSYAGLPANVRALPANAPQEGEPYERLRVWPGAGLGIVGRRLEIAVTATWGWETVPDTVVEATLLQANRLASRRDSPYGIAGSPDSGSEIRLLSRLDPDVQVILRDYQRTGKVG